MSGLAQRRRGAQPCPAAVRTYGRRHLSRIVTGTADLVIAADEVVAGAKETISLCESSRNARRHHTHLIRSRISSKSRFQFPEPQGQRGAGDRVAQGFSSFFDFTKPAEALLGDAIATNI